MTVPELPTWRRYLLSGLALAAGAVLVACGGGGDEGGGEAAPAAQPASTAAATERTTQESAAQEQEPRAAPAAAPAAEAAKGAETQEAETAPREQPAPATPAGLVTTLADVQTAVVRIVAEGSFRDPEFGEVLNSAGSGTGFIIDRQGLAVTNNHVVTGAALLRVYVGGSADPVNARVLGVSECSDLALIDLSGEDYPYVAWYEGTPQTGLDVFAAGYPLGDPEFTLTRGIISKADADGESEWASVDAVLEHDARLNPGN